MTEAGAVPDILGMRFVEIGRPWLKRILPKQTTCFASELPRRRPGTPAPAEALYGEPLRRLRSALADPAIAVIVCHPSMFAPWDARWLLRALFNRRLLRTGLPISTTLGPQMLRTGTAAPIAVVDLEDLPVIKRCNLFLLDCATLYFKRELPIDHWKVFLRTDHHGVPTPRYRLRPRNRSRIEKLAPLSLGLKIGSEGHFPPRTGKSIDIFYAGRVEGSSTVRQAGLGELASLAAHGVSIDVAQGPLLPEEFYKRAAAARLVWSPEGLGWDCFRHYEAAMCGSVPLINNPAIERYRPLLGGEHAIYYDIEPGGLTRAVIGALADRRRLEEIGQAAKAHVEAYHAPLALARHVLHTTLARARARAST